MLLTSESRPTLSRLMKFVCKNTKPLLPPKSTRMPSPSHRSYTGVFDICDRVSNFCRHWSRVRWPAVFRYRIWLQWLAIPSHRSRIAEAWCTEIDHRGDTSLIADRQYQSMLPRQRRTLSSAERREQIAGWRVSSATTSQCRWSTAERRRSLIQNTG